MDAELMGLGPLSDMLMARVVQPLARLYYDDVRPASAFPWLQQAVG
jgi:hypothetical protein